MIKLLPLLLTLAAALPSLAEPAWINVDSKIYARERSVLLSLPKSYMAGGKRYPVLYVTDATQQGLHTAATVEALSAIGRMPEMIVIGVWHQDRINELTPTRVPQATVDGDVLRFPTSGGAAKLLAFLETELIPEIDKRYRTEPFRILGGHSYGGMFALDALFTNPKLFNTVIAISPTVWWDNKYILRRAQQFVQANPEVKSTIALAVGKESASMNAGFEELKAVFTQPPKSTSVHTFYFENEDHFSTPIPATYSALRKIFAPWLFKIESPDDPMKLWARAQAHAQELSKQYGYRVGVAEDTANEIGYILLRARRFEQALEVFQANVAANPASANAYDSLGDMYNAAGDTQKAWQNYERAVALAKSSKDPLLGAFEQKLADFKRRNPAMFPPQIRR